ncbi:Desumoylating isopeptidase 2 [Blomia tropicalis]|nr:Desumoylating isopeptidase 2 [Blomia tropicalis]
MTDSFPVRLNVYGLTNLNDRLKSEKIGIYHVGVEVHKTEWSYGYHRYPISGIYTMQKPLSLESLSKDPRMFYVSEQIAVGTTVYTHKQISDHLSMIGRNDWTGLKYHIIFKNSIEFANKLCYYLCGKNIPPWINCFPIIYQKHSEVIVEIPEEFRTPVALKEMIQQKLEFAHKLQQQPKQQKAIVSTNANDNQNDGKVNRSIDPENVSLDRFIDSKILAAPSMEEFNIEMAKEALNEDQSTSTSNNNSK